MDDIQIITQSQSPSAPTFPKISLNRAGWVSYGPKNDFPQQLIALNSRSPVNSSIIESTVTYICGKGVRDTEAAKDTYVGVPNPGQSWDDIIEPIAKDYKTFGGFYFQVILNKSSNTVSLFHQDFSAVRIGRINETGDPLSFRVSNDWTKTSGKNKPIELETWPGIKKAKKGQAYLYSFYDYAPGIQYYCVPGYFPAMEYIKADGTLGSFYNNSIDNGFTPSVTITMPSNPPEAQKAEFQSKMERAYGGAKGACSVIVIWGEADGAAPKIVPFAATANADIYNNVEAIVFQKIISAHRLASPTLAGVSGSGNLSGNAAEIIDAYVLYNYTVIEKMRRKIIDTLNIFTSINKTGKLSIDELDVLAKIRESAQGSGAILTINDGSAKTDTVDSLASKLGVGGTQALTTIMESPTLNDNQKRGLMGVLFGLTEDDINKLFNVTAAALSNAKSFINKFKAFLTKWN